MSGTRSLADIFRWPLTLGAITLAGLLSALLGDGVWDWLSWLLLAVPAGACGMIPLRKT